MHCSDGQEWGHAARLNCVQSYGAIKNHNSRPGEMMKKIAATPCSKRDKPARQTGLRSLSMLAAAMMLAALSAPLHAQIKPKVALSSNVGQPVYVGWEKLAEGAKAKTGGRVDFALFAGLQLGGELEAAEKIKLGAIEAGSITSSVFASWIPDVEVLDLPFLFRDEDHLLASYPLLREKLAPKFDAQGFHLLGFTMAGPRHLVSRFPIRTIDDVKGKKMRVLQNPIHVATWKLLGANPTPLPAPEIYNAMQTGVIDYFDFVKSSYYSLKFYEVGKYFTNTGHINALFTWVVSNAYWRRLSAADRQAIDQLAAELAGPTHKASVAYDDEALLKAVALGTQVYTVTDKEPWRKRMEPVWRALVDSIQKVK